MNRSELIEQARRTRRNLRRKRSDVRFQRVMGRLAAAGIMDVAIDGITPYRKPVPLEDYLWVGKIEPRVLELLPAIVMKKPSLLKRGWVLPEDLRAATDALRRATPAPPFRGVPPEKYARWVEEIGHRGKSPTTLKTFRFGADEQRRLRRLKTALSARSEAAVIRLALERLEKQVSGQLFGQDDG